MTAPRYLVALTEGQLATLRRTCETAIAAGEGGDWPRGSLRHVNAVADVLAAAERHDVVLGLSTAEANALWSFADQAGDDEDMSSTRPATLAAGRRAMRALTRAIGSS